ncbi:nucleotidyl transferase AbiEii/AbiGii toxin family protein (plasmid) [Thermanaerothrix sp. 4228-RoL]|uniref:Nucleotidyl transferase AbiEii/AbiGii toxin family protein n=1 Tax=Thermanaerothrix solaris TaxID=3058434 RepID=A0ABU3NRW5_9CHLR|nr:MULTISPECIES: nucleotidyl transferase AbiEii/AbiGii toxin family protein [unclassified Thermanaerothrix]MDT8899563.1 nucleotidyl transferase AbiEii/AbiGii toxin family protein [Thermanaerothrix sp. 4228-RoL]
MKYKSGDDFRRALEERLRRMSLDSGTPILRLRKAVAFERFLARLIKAQPQDWVLKGGFMIQLRLGGQSRVTKDIDLLFRQALDTDEVHQQLVEAAALDLGDWFGFNVAYPSQSGTHLRFEVECFLGGRRFEVFPLDVGTGDLLVGEVEHLCAPPLLDFADIEPVSIPSYPVSQQIAEKVHALTRPYATGGSSRVKDAVDILLLAGQSHLRREDLFQALAVTFEVRQTHPLPVCFPDLPKDWQRSLREEAEKTGLGEITLEEADQRLKAFLDPVFGQRPQGNTWDPLRWEWC